MDCCTNSDAPTATTTSAARGNPGARSERFTLGGSVVAAVLSSACCWLPLLLLAFGASAAGVSAFFEQWRPAFLVLAVALLGAGFYVVYFRKASCAKGACETMPRSPRVFSRALLWVAALLVALFAMFPNYAGAIARTFYGSRGTDKSATIVAGATLHRFRVEGMTCEACAVTLEADLVKLDGVSSARVDYPSKTAEVRSAAADIESRVRAVAERHGYRAAPDE